MTAESGRELNDLFTVLTNQRRRYLLYHLEELDENVVELDDLAEAVVEMEADATTRLTHHRDVRVMMVHNHLPKLASLGIVEYDERSGSVRYHGHPMLTEQLAVVRKYE